MFNPFKRLINNVRQGFATNSSSSHSMVYVSTPVSDSTHYGDNQFGWEDFTLDSLGEKLLYALVMQIGGYWGADDAREEALEQAMKDYGHLFPEFDREAFSYAMDGYVDHQSYVSLDEALEAARDPHVVIEGGNDNGY